MKIHKKIKRMVSRISRHERKEEISETEAAPVVDKLVASEPESIPSRANNYPEPEKQVQAAPAETNKVSVPDDVLPKNSSSKPLMRLPEFLWSGCTKKTKIIIGAGLAVLVIFSLWWFGMLPGKFNRIQPDPDAGLMSNRNAYDVSLEEAHKWDPGAELFRLTSYEGKTGVTGRSDDWDSIFVSKNKKNLGYEVIVRNRQISSAREIPLVAEGGTLPESTITSKEAIAKVRQIPGYETIPIISVEMVYGPDGAAWYWGVKTEKGVVAIDAKK